MRFAFLFCAGCAGSIPYEGAVSPAEAAKSALPPVAIVRGEKTIELAEGATVQGGRVRMTKPAIYVHKLGPDDVIAVDDDGAITAVQTPKERIEFKPKTAVSPEGSDEVRGELASSEPEASVVLERGDKILVRGSLKPGDEVPGGGRVVSRRLTGALVLGVVSFAGAYIPSAIAGASGGEPERALLAPVGGPWAYLVAKPACTIDPIIGANCIPDAVARFGAVMSGMFQAIGVVFLLVGAPAHVAIQDPKEPEKPSVSVVPLPGGAGLVGRL